MKVLKYKRGQIWWYRTGVKFDGNTYNESKPRPVIIMSNDRANENSNCLLAIPCTTAEKRNMPTHINFEMNGNQNIALAENLMSISTEKLGDYIGMVDKELLEKLEYIVAVALGLTKYIKREKPELGSRSLNNDVNPVENKPDLTAKPGRRNKYTIDDMIRFVNDYENHAVEFMLQKYELKDKKALQQKAYQFRKHIKENS